MTQPPPYQFVRSTQEQFTISVSKHQLRDGDVVVVWFTVSDAAGNKDDVRQVVALDRTLPQVTAEEFITVDEFTSKYVTYLLIYFTYLQGGTKIGLVTSVVPNISRCTVATPLKCSWSFSDDFITNVLLNLNGERII